MATNGSSKGSSNGNSNGRQVPVNASTSGWEPDFRDNTILALRENGGLQRIQSTLRQRMDESGWSQNLKEYCTALFRSGEAKTYEEALALVKKRVYSESGDSSATQGGVPAPDLAIPDEAKMGGAEVVKKELLAVVTPKPAK